MKKDIPKSYSDFSLTHLQTMFGIQNLYRDFELKEKKITPSNWLIETLELQKNIPKGTEKAKSEHLVVPILLELYRANQGKFQYFSGYTFDVDTKLALRGRCDFLLSKTLSASIEAPIFGIFEAKDDSVEHWYGQCGAEMYAAQLFNQQKNNPIQVIHGAVSNGLIWQFLRLENKILNIDTRFYGIENPEQLLGVLQGILDFYGD
jgi:hypothetical protein